MAPTLLHIANSEGTVDEIIQKAVGLQMASPDGTRRPRHGRTATPGSSTHFRCLVLEKQEPRAVFFPTPAPTKNTFWGPFSGPFFDLQNGPLLCVFISVAPFRGPFFDPQNGAQNRAKNGSKIAPESLQVLAFLQWTHWLFANVHIHHKPIVLNMDETSIARAAIGKRGYVLKRGCERDAIGLERFSTREARGNCTLVAVIAEDPELQPHCKQILLTRDASLDAATKRHLRALDSPLEWMPGTSGWTNTDSLCKILTSIRRPFSTNFPERPIVLYLDSAAQHASKRVLAHANRLRVQLVFVPASLTWLLQPLDTHVFSLFKRRMVSVQQQIRSDAADGRLPAVSWLRILDQAIRDVIQSRDWQRAFSGNGLLGCHAGLRPCVLEGLGCFLPLAPRPPTEEEMCSVVGRRRIAIRMPLLSEALRVRRQAEASTRAAMSSDAVPGAHDAGEREHAAAAATAGTTAASSSSGVAARSRADVLRLPFGRRLGFRPP